MSKTTCQPIRADPNAYPDTIAESASICVTYKPWIAWKIFCLGLTLVYIALSLYIHVKRRVIHTWPYFLTTWSNLCALVFWISSLVATSVIQQQYNQTQGPNEELSLDELTPATLVFVRIARVSGVIAPSMNIFVAGSFWVFLFRPSSDLLYLIQTSGTHGVIGCLLLVDSVASARWSYFRDLWKIWLFSVVWGCWSVVHYALNLSNGHGCRCIYTIINWEKNRFRAGVMMLLLLFAVSLYYFLIVGCGNCFRRLFWDNAGVDVLTPYRVDRAVNLQISTPVLGQPSHAQMVAVEV